MPEFHGMRNTPEYGAWAGMKRRCNNPNYQHYAYYGGRGIKVCAKWDSSFVAFLADVGFRPSPRHELDRIKSDLGYEPGNCRWVLHDTQMRNRRFCRIFTHNEKTQTLAEWARDIGISPSTLRERLSKWPVGQCLSAPKGLLHASL